jgi:hypothetical protein
MNMYVVLAMSRHAGIMPYRRCSVVDFTRSAPEFFAPRPRQGPHFLAPRAPANPALSSFLSSWVQCACRGCSTINYGSAAYCLGATVTDSVTPSARATVSESDSGWRLGPGLGLPYESVVRPVGPGPPGRAVDSGESRCPGRPSQPAGPNRREGLASARDVWKATDSDQSACND